MQKKYSEEEIRKAIEQAIANIEMEDVMIDYNKNYSGCKKIKRKARGRKNGFK